MKVDLKLLCCICLFLPLLHRPEEVYEVESVFGRDAAAVFPNLKANDDPLEALKASLGAKRFVTESEVSNNSNSRGCRQQSCPIRAGPQARW